MKRLTGTVLAVVMTLMFCACGQTETTPTWQEQYDLGLKYLNEGNYQEAILAFTAAIEIDPKQAVIYSGRGQAYVLSGETQENLVAALADFEQAIALDEMLAEGWLGLADVYIRMGEYDKAKEILQTAQEKTTDQAVSDKLAKLDSDQPTDATGQVERKVNYTYDDSGAVKWIREELYDEQGIRFRINTYNSNWELSSYVVWTDWNENGMGYSCTVYEADGSIIYHIVETWEGNDCITTHYDTEWNVIEQHTQRYDN